MASREELVNALCGGASCSRCGVVGPKEKLVVWETGHLDLYQYFGVERSKWYEYSIQELRGRFDLERNSPRFLLCTGCSPENVDPVYLNKARRTIS